MTESMSRFATIFLKANSLTLPNIKLFLALGLTKNLSNVALWKIIYLYPNTQDATNNLVRS